MNPCPDNDDLLRLIQNLLSPEALPRVQEHVLGCSPCQTFVVKIRAARVAMEGFLATAQPAPAAPPREAAKEPLKEAPKPAGPDSLEGFPMRLAEYQLLTKLGHGAMGSVFEAHDRFLDRRVAIKFINAKAMTPDAHERFLREARAIARLHHPNIIVVHRIGQYEDSWYLVSELVRGKSLDKLEKPLPTEQAVRIARELARGLGAAHRRGVLHRDIKPANAILADTGEVKLLDFGLAKLLETSTDGDGALLLSRSVEDMSLSPALTQAGALMGTPLYMAPEILKGGRATTRSDIYSLGSLLYELTSGVRPYQAKSVLELAFMVQERDPRPLGDLASWLPPSFSALIDRCLRRDPAARPASCEELCQILDGLVAPEGQPRSAPLPEGNPYRGLRPFEAEHRGLFFGRETEIQELLDRLRSDAMILLCGDSGVGKSSLCRAGILPAITEGALRGGRLWSAVSLTPGPRPLATLADTLASLCNLSESEVSSRIFDDPGSVIQALVQNQGEQRGVALFIDQLEELVTQGERGEAARVAEFLGHLSVLVPGVRLLMTGRIDFLARLAALPGLGRELEKSLYIVRPLSTDGLREAVTGPATRLGFSFESDEMVDELVQSSVAAEGGLPLLQFALSELWRSRDQERHIIPARALLQIGGVTGALARHADAVVEQLLPGQRAAARRLLSRLITEEGTRASRTGAELIGNNDTDGQAALEALVKGRLLVARESSSGVGTYEIAHEALLSGWDTLRRWLAQDVEDRAARLRLDRAAGEWVRLSRAKEALWNDRQMQELSPTLLSEGLSAQEAEFVHASQHAARRRRWIFRGAMAAVPVLLLLLYGGIQFKLHLDVMRQTQAQIVQAQGYLSDARKGKVRLDSLQQQAFGRFDARDPQGGERIWQQAVELFPEVEGHYRQASRAMEAALVLDRSGPATRRLFAEILYEQALLLDSSTAPYGRSQQEDLIQRLQTYDNGTFRVRLYQPGRMDLATSPPGAVVTLRQYMEKAGIYELSAPRQLGQTPLRGVSLPPGSYLLELAAQGRPLVRYPLLMNRGEHLELSVPLPESVPAGFVYVPPGRFLYGAGSDEVLRRVYETVQPQHAVSTQGYLIGRTEVTFKEWMSYLRSLPEGERTARLPRGDWLQQSHVSLQQMPDGTFQLSLRPVSVPFVLREGERLEYPVRTQHKSHDWSLLPVTGISYEDAVAYTGWLDRSGNLPGARLCSEYEWERAARGADTRMLPHANVLRPEDANHDVTYGRDPRSFGPDQVGSHPASDSPFGVADLAGNAWEWTKSVVADMEVVYRGGSWYQGVASARSINRQVGETTHRSPLVGLRVCASPR